MKILVASALKSGSHIAHAINTVKMADAFARCGHEVALLCARGGEETDRPRERSGLYGISSDLRWLELKGVRNAHWSYAIRALPRLVTWGPDLVYSRNYLLPWISSGMGIPTIAESHAHVGKQTPEFLRLVRASRRRAFWKWITISPVLRDYYASMGAPAEKIEVLADAVDFELFRRPERLPEGPYEGPGPHVVYAGHLYDYKGIPTVLKAAARQPENQFHFIGGLAEDIERQRALARDLGCENVRFHGPVEHAKMPCYLWHADLLLLPPSADHPSARWTSPMKLGEYLASGTPVIASEIPALRHWLDESTVRFFRPDDAGSLAEAIAEALRDAAGSSSRASHGLRWAEDQSFGARAKRILAHLETGAS